MATSRTSISSTSTNGGPRPNGWEDKVLCKYLSHEKKSSFFNRKTKEEFKDSFCKLQKRNGVITFYAFKIKPGNVLKPLFETIISDIDEIDCYESEGYAEMTLKTVPGAIVRFLSFDSRDRFMSYIFRIHHRGSSSPSALTTSSMTPSKSRLHDEREDEESLTEKSDAEKPKTGSNDQISMATPHKASASTALAFAKKSFNSYDEEEDETSNANVNDNSHLHHVDDDEFDFTPATTEIIHHHAHAHNNLQTPDHSNQSHPNLQSAADNKQIAVHQNNDFDDEFSIGGSSLPPTAMHHVANDQTKEGVNEESKSINYSPTSEEDRMMSSQDHAHIRATSFDDESIDVDKILESIDAAHVPVTITPRKDTVIVQSQQNHILQGQFKDSKVIKPSLFGNIELPPPQSLPANVLPTEISSESGANIVTQSEEFNEKSETIQIPEKVSSPIELKTKEDEKRSEQLVIHGHGSSSSMAPPSSLVNLLVGTDKPMRKSHRRDPLQQQELSSSMQLPSTNNRNALPAETNKDIEQIPPSLSSSESPQRLTASVGLSKSVELPISEYDLSQSYHHASLRGAALTTHDLKSPLQIEGVPSQSQSHIMPPQPPFLSSSSADIAYYPTETIKPSQKSAVVRLSDIATRESVSSVQQMPNVTKPIPKQDQQNVLYLQREIESLVRLNDHLNAALERSELMRQEDAMEYSQRIEQLQCALEEMTILSASNPPIINPYHMEEASAHTDIVSDIHIENLPKDAIKMDIDLENERLKWAEEKQEMQDLIGLLNVQLKQHKDENDELQALNTSLQQTIDSLSSEIMSLEEKQAVLINEKEQLEEARVILERTIVEQSAQTVLNQEILSKELAQQAMEKQVHQLRTQLDMSQSHEEYNKTTVMRLEKLVQEQQQLIKDLSERLQQNEQVDQQTLHSMQLKLLTNQEETVKLTLDKEQLERDNQRLQALCDQLKKEMNSKTQEFEGVLNSRQSHVQELQLQLQQAQFDNEKLSAENQVLSRRLQLSKDQENKLQQDVENLSHRVVLEQQSLQTQLTSYRVSMDTAKQSYDELFAKYQHLEVEHRRLSLEKQQGTMDLEEKVNVLKKTNQDLVTRNGLLTEQNDDLTTQLAQEKASKKKYKEQIHQLEIQTTSERKTLQQKLLELQNKLDQQTQWWQQSDTQLKQSEETRKHLQETMSQSLQTQTERYQSLHVMHEQLTKDMEVLQEERRKEQRAYEETIRGLNRTIDNFKNSQVQLERQVSSLESEYLQLQQASNLKTQEQENQYKAASDRITDLLRETQDLAQKLSQEEMLQSKYHQQIDALRNKAAAFTQVYQLSFHSNPTEDVVTYVQEIFTWFSKTFHDLQEEVSLLSNQHDEQETYWKKRIASLEETVIQTSSSWKEAQQKLEATEKKHLEHVSETQAISLQTQKKDFTIQELTLQLDAGRKDYHHVLDQNSQLEKQLAEEKQKVKNLDHSLKMTKEKETTIQDELQQLRLKLGQSDSAKQMISEQLQSLQRLHTALEVQEHENENKTLQILKDLNKEKMLVADAMRQLEQSQRRKESLEQELAETKQYWDTRWQTVSIKMTEDEIKWKDSTVALEKELRQAHERCANLDEKLRHVERELQRAVAEKQSLQHEVETMVSKVLLERLQQDYSLLEAQYTQEKQSWRETTQQSHEHKEKLEKEVLQYQRLLTQIQEMVIHAPSLPSTKSLFVTPSKGKTIATARSLLASPDNTAQPFDDSKPFQLIDRLQELVQEEKLLISFCASWLDAFRAAGLSVGNDSETTVTDSPLPPKTEKSQTVGEGQPISYHYLQRLQSLLQYVPPPVIGVTSVNTSTSTLSLTNSLVKEFQDAFILNFYQPLLQEYERVRQDYEATYYYYTTQSAEVERLQQQTQALEEQVAMLRQQRQQQEDLHKQTMKHFEDEQQRLFQEQEALSIAHREEVQQLQQQWTLKWQQNEQQRQQQEATFARQAQLSLENEKLVWQEQHDRICKTKDSELQSLQDQVRMKDALIRSLEESLEEKTLMLRRKAEELQLLEDRYQQQRQQLMSLQDEREQLKRVSAALEEKSREEEAVYRRLEVDMFAMQEKLRTRSEQVRLLTEQIEALEIEVAEETVAKERVERQLEKVLMKQTTNNSSVPMVKRSSSIQTQNSTNNNIGTSKADNAIQSLVQRRKYSGQFSTNNSHATAAASTTNNANRPPVAASSKEKPSTYFETDEDDHESREKSLINHPTTKLARLRNKIAQHASHEQSLSSMNSKANIQESTMSVSDLDRSTASTAQPLRLQDLLHN